MSTIWRPVASDLFKCQPDPVGFTPRTVARKKILFIDNRPEHLQQPLLRLQLAGYDVETANSGLDGLKRLRSNGFDLMIIDSELPDDDGWSVLRQVRKDPKLKDLRVIMFMAERGETGKLALVPVDAELRRPFSLGTLLEAVEKVLGDR
jgi:two-component system, chemotaxis family, chemotaxis protein CheY